jgi:hypothetical protein
MTTVKLTSLVFSIKDHQLLWGGGGGVAVPKEAGNRAKKGIHTQFVQIWCQNYPKKPSKNSKNLSLSHSLFSVIRGYSKKIVQKCCGVRF